MRGRHGSMPACAARGPAARVSGASRLRSRWRLLLEDELAALVRPAYPRQERHAEQVNAQRLIGRYQGRKVAHHNVADLDHAQLHQSRAADAIGGMDLDLVVARRGMDAEPG